jgi:HSP20 family protein
MNTFPNRFHRSASPFAGLSDMLLREMNDIFRTHDAVYQGGRGVYPPVNLEETDEGYVLTAELPGVSPDDIDVSIEGSTVTLAGQRKVEYAAGEGTSVHRRERPSGHFRRAFELPAEIDVAQAKASHKNGVLTLSLPKSPALRPRQIQIETC